MNQEIEVKEISVEEVTVTTELPRATIKFEWPNTQNKLKAFNKMNRADRRRLRKYHGDLLRD